MTGVTAALNKPSWQHVLGLVSGLLIALFAGWIARRAALYAAVYLGFVVAWQTRIKQGSSFNTDVLAQRFSAAGSKLGNDFVVNLDRTGNQVLPAAAMDSTGNFVIAFFDIQADIIYAQRYNASGS